MEELTPSWHAEHTPDASALVMAETGETVTYAELEDRSRRLAPALLRARGVVRRRPHRRADGEQPALPRGDLGGPAVGAATTRPINSHLRPGEVQYVLDDCGAVGAGDVRGDGRRRRRPRPVAHPGADVGGRRAPGLRALRRGARGCGARPARRRARGPGDAVLVGHDRAAQGRAQAAAGHAVRRPVGHAGAAGPGARHAGQRRRRRLGLPVPRTALPRRAARLLDVDAAPRRDGRRDGAVRSAPVPRADRAPPGDARAVRADDVRAHAPPARGRARAPRPVEPAVRGARRRAVPGPGEAPDDRVVGPDHPRVLLRHRGHRQHVHHRRRSGWPTPARSAGRSTSATSSATTARSCRPARRGSSTSPAAARSSTTTTPTRRRRSPTTGGGGRSATSATSTRTATSTSPTARRT